MPPTTTALFCTGPATPAATRRGLDPRTHGIYSDDYLWTEVLTGHPAMVSRPFGRDVVGKYWLTQDLMRALALRTIEDVTFVDDDLHRQHVRWSDGGQVWVNRGVEDWKVPDPQPLPPYGFLSRADGGRRSHRGHQPPRRDDRGKGQLARTALCQRPPARRRGASNPAIGCVGYIRGRRESSI